MISRGWRDISEYSDGHTVKWYRCDPAFFEMMNNLIESAERIIHFQVYLIDPDSTGKKLMQQLINAAQRGVEVNLVVDDFGAGSLGKHEELMLTEAGVNFKRFEPYLSSRRYYVGRRMHHKILVVDEKTAIVGGMNVADRYHGTENMLPWLDYAVLVEGPVCTALVQVCKYIMERQFKPSVPKLPKMFSKPQYLNPERVWARLRRNDWLRNSREITRSYNKAVRLSKSSITIVGGYFLPGHRFLELLASAAERGVDVKIILTRFSDVPVVKYASEYLYDNLLNNKIRIFEAKDVMVHGKVAVVDETFSTIGSYNQNHLSAYLSIEMNVDIVNSAFSKNLNEHLHEVITNECIEITRESFYSHSGIIVKIRRWMAYRLVRLSLRMLFTINRYFTVSD